MTTDADADHSINGLDEPTTMQINAQYIKDFSFENPNSPSSLQPKSEPSVEVNVDVQAAPLSDHVYEVSLTTSITGRDETQTLFIIELVYAGIFTFRGESDDNIQPALLIDCPQLLFPFTRSIISGVTQNGGFPPLLLQPVNFAQLYIDSKKDSEPSAPK
ncbi:protein-export chaperone SecB [bacterium]|nr:protein-export chaperone SecB [bacterium]MDC0432764.1 protein-export chaperone SecB [bacterium]